MSLTSLPIRTYHVFVASPGDVNAERQAVREYFADYNRSVAQPRGFRFEVVDWENYSVAGAGRPQELITRQILERYRSSLALVIGIMAQRFGSPSGTHESGTEEEFEWALANVRSGFPELAWFFRDIRELKLDPKNPADGLAQWKQVEAFRARVEAEKKVFCRPYPTSEEFRAVLRKNLDLWLNASERPWFADEDNVVAAPAEWPPETLESLSQRLNEEFAQHMSGGEGIPLADARARYIQSIVRRRTAPRPKSDRENLPPGDEAPLADLIMDAGAQLLIVGAGGAGKTTLLRQLAASGAQRAVHDSSAPVFVYLRLTSFDRNEGAFDALMNLLSLAARTARPDFEQRWRSGSRPMTLLLDGLNEVAAAYRSACTQAMWTLLQNSSPRHRYVVTSRPGGELESMAANSVDHRELRVADILPFSWSQVREYLAAQGRSDLSSRLSGELEGLASNPFLLWAIVRTSADSPDIRNRGTLFQALIGDYIFEKRERRKPAPRPTTYNYPTVKEPVLARLALTMIERGMTDVADGPGLYQEIGGQLIGLEQANKRALALQAETFMPENYSGEALVREIVENGVLVRESDRLRFMHEAVQEYFAALGCRDEAPDALAQRVRPVNLARLESREPTFEMLVTWAGLATPDAVAHLVESLRLKHPLLAAHLAREAALGEEHLESLRKELISLADSHHERRRALAVLGLTTLPSDDPRAVTTLLRLLRKTDLGYKIVEALKATATSRTLSLVIASWLTTAEDLTDTRVRMIRQVAADNPRLVAEALLDQWQNAEASRARLTLLAKYIDERQPSDEPPARITATLTALASEAELAGSVGRSAALDDLRGAIEAAPPSPGVDGIVTFGERIRQSMDRVFAWLDEKKQFKASLAGMSNAELGVLVASEGDARKRSVILEMLVERSAPEAVDPVLSASLADQSSRWTLDVQALPRDLVRSRLDELSATLDGEPRRRAKLIAELVSESPDATILAGIFDEGSVPLRTAAATAAGRGGTAGVELLLNQLTRESDQAVIEGILKALGASRSAPAAARLLDLVFDHGAREQWPRSGDSGPFSSGGWEPHIHDALAALGQETAVLDRVEQLLRTPDPGRHEDAILEAARWLPSSRATGILKEAARRADTRTVYIAVWSLATTGDADAWRKLVDLELHGDYLHLGDAATRAQSSLDPLITERLNAVSRSLIYPALAATDEERRVAAINLTIALPTDWIDEPWLTQARAVVKELIQSPIAEKRAWALESLGRVDDSWESTALELLDHDPDPDVQREAYRRLGDRANDHLLTRLRRFLASGDAENAKLVARRFKGLGSSDNHRAACDAAAEQLQSDDQSSRIASVIALAALYQSYKKDEAGWQALIQRVRNVFDRNGPAETWQALVPYLDSSDSDEREFVHQVVKACDETATEYRQLASLIYRSWPDDLHVAALCVLLATREDGPRAEPSVRDFESRFAERINSVWLGARYEEAGLAEDSRRHYLRAVEENSTEPLPYFKLGWVRFLEGDFAGSIELTRRALDLDPTLGIAEFNLGLAYLVQHDVPGAEDAYRRGLAVTKRQRSVDAIQTVDAAIGDLDQFMPLGEREAGQRVRGWLVAERERLAARA